MYQRQGRDRRNYLQGRWSPGWRGWLLSIEVKVGDSVNGGDLVAMIEAMKMRRHLHTPHSGVVKEIWARIGEIVNPEDVLMVVG